jgi:hypothetical protein
LTGSIIFSPVTSLSARPSCLEPSALAALGGLSWLTDLSVPLTDYLSRNVTAAIDAQTNPDEVCLVKTRHFENKFGRSQGARVHACESSRCDLERLKSL